MAGRKAELVLGSVQLGLAYGIANKTGKPSNDDALALVRRAADAGIRGFDTARAYGDSEERLGRALRGREVFTVTKLSPLADLPPDAARDAVRAAVDSSIAQSCAALGLSRLPCLLLHRAVHMTDHDGAIWWRLLEHLRDGTVERLGVSVQSPREALAALANSAIRHIQMPFNLLDWRWREAGVPAACLTRPGVTVHTRSVFLQGLLAADDPVLWPRIEGVDAVAVLATLRGLVRDLGRESLADLCLAYVRGQDFVDGVVVGMETAEQLDLNLHLAAKRPLEPEECAVVADRVPRLPEQLLDPAQWPKP